MANLFGGRWVALFGWQNVKFGTHFQPRHTENKIQTRIQPTYEGAEVSHGRNMSIPLEKGKHHAGTAIVSTKYASG